MKKFDIIGFGALNVDKVYIVDKIAGSGEESFIIGYNESCGGSAANTAAAIAKLGLSVGYIGSIADDREGDLLLKDFDKNNVETKGITLYEEGRSGNVLALVDRKGERALYVDPGVNDLLTWNNLNIQYASSTKLIHLTSFVGETPLKAQIELLNKLDRTIKVSLDPGEIYASKGLDFIKPLIARTDILLLNEREVYLLTGLAPQEGASSLAELGPKLIVVKLGEKGCYATESKQQISMDAFKVDVLDTTGAGDAFNAGFLYGFLRDLKLSSCLRLGNFTASKCIAQVGARNGLPTKNEVETFLEVHDSK